MSEDSPDTNCQNNTINEWHTILLVNYAIQHSLHSTVRHNDTPSGIPSPTSSHPRAPLTAASISTTSPSTTAAFRLGALTPIPAHHAQPIFIPVYAGSHYVLIDFVCLRPLPVFLDCRTPLPLPHGHGQLLQTWHTAIICLRQLGDIAACCGLAMCMYIHIK
jgi:hypothetical protein